MITLNQKAQALTLKPVFKNSACPELVVKKDGHTTLISEEKTLYVYFASEKITASKIYKFMINFAKTNTYNINVNVDDFKAAAKCNANGECSLNPDNSFKMGKAIFEGLLFGSHCTFTMKTGQKEACCNYTINIMSSCQNAEKNFAQSLIKMEYVNFARDLQDTPPNLMTSVVLADTIAAKAKELNNVKVTILNKKDIEAYKMGLLLGVNAGSPVEPRIVVLEYNGDSSSQEKIGLVGKGITFDSGGYNLKPSEFMKGMKFDMSGAAIMCSTLMAVAKAGLKVNMVAVGCLTDNRIGATATLPESVLTSMNGKTVQINNTDAEGRLVLADGITYAIREKKVTKLIEASTLTGAILIALGKFMTGVFATCNSWYDAFAIGSQKSGEEIWRMPIHEDNTAAIRKTPIADLTNVAAGREGGSSTAAAFLIEFTEDKPYLHLDIAGTADTHDGHGTGVMLRTIFEMFA